MRRQKIVQITGAVIILCLITMIGVIYLCSVKVNRNLTIEMRNTLSDVAEQNNVAVQKEIDARFQLLYSFAQEIEENPDEVKVMMDSMKSFEKNYQFQRIGYIYPIGVAYTTDGYIQDLSYLDYFQAGMEGDATITEGFDTIEGEQKKYTNCLSVPVYNEDRTEIMGVLFAVFEPQWLESMLNSYAFEGKGYCCIIKEDGEVIAHSSQSPIHDIDNFFQRLKESERGQKTVDDMQAVMQQGLSGTGNFLMGSEQKFYYTPLNLENGDLNWYMVTIVPAEVLNARMRPIMRNVEQLVISILIIIVCGVSFFLWSHRIRRKELMRLAYTDSLTAGDNFACFQEKMKRKRDVHGYLIAMDLSDFKIINNTCGVEMGDQVLVHVWQVLHDSIRGEELAARIYADRFILFLVESNKEALEARLEKMISDMESVSKILNTPRVIPVCGIYETINQEPIETGYGNAVQAKHLVKGRRDRRYAFYEEIDYEQVLEKRGIEDGFEQAITDKEFEIWYQPKYDTYTCAVVGAEALVRWRKADGTLLPPIKFIPVFEKNGMIPRLDEYVFRSVCMQQKKWEQEGREILPISVNISRISLYYYYIVEKYKKISEESHLETKYVQLEITESATIGNSEIANLIEEFHQAGFRMLLDDFGSGYSSLSTLNVMHFDTVKLDKSLIDYIGDENGEKLLHYIMKLGQNLGLRITAEGVETKEQLEFLRNLQCDDIQGYYFSKPLPLEDFEKLLA